MPWTRVYAVTTPGLCFDMLFNHANPLSHEAGQGPGSFMCYAGARAAEPLLGLPGDHIRERFLADLFRLYPQLRGQVEETVLQRWEIGNVYGTPGARLDAIWRYARRRDMPVHLAGDYFGAQGGLLDAAVRSGFDAADAVLDNRARWTTLAAEVG
jgi:oxygen-dependent protoporphyrinogen oxidase